MENNLALLLKATVGVAIVMISEELYRIYLIRYISQMNFKIKQEQNQLQ